MDEVETVAIFFLFDVFFFLFVLSLWQCDAMLRSK